MAGYKVIFPFQYPEKSPAYACQHEHANNDTLKRRIIARIHAANAKNETNLELRRYADCFSWNVNK